MSQLPPLSIRNILLLTISALSLLVAMFTLQQVFQEWRRMQEITELKSAMKAGDLLFDAAERLSVERDVTFFIIHSPDKDAAASLEDSLKESREAVDRELPAALLQLRAYNLPGLSGPLTKVWADRAHMRQVRDTVDQQAALPAARRDKKLAGKWFDDATGLITDTRSLWAEFIERFNDIDPIVTLQIRMKHLLGVITEYAGQERALIGRLIVENARPSPGEQANLLRWQGMLDLSWRNAAALASEARLSPDIDPLMKDAQSHYYNLYDMMEDIFYVPGAKVQTPYPIDAATWLELATEASDSLYALKDGGLKETQSYIAGLDKTVRDTIATRLLVLILALALCFYCFRVVTYRVLKPIHRMVQALLDTTEGKSVTPMPIPEGRNDEISNLGRVLASFQKTMADMRRYTSALERSNKELDEFAYIAAHDLREPLRGIHNNARFLLDDNAERLDEASVRRIDRLIYLSQRIEKLVNDLMYFSRLGRQELAVAPTDMNEVIEDIEKTMEDFISRNNAKILIQSRLPTITCDRTRITEVFRNLIVNGIKYNSKKEKTIEIGYVDRMNVDGRETTGVFFVKDNGHGILKEFHDEIFRIFRRLEVGQRTTEEGTGVGLTFVRKIIERHGGRIWLESTPGAGTVFYFTLKEMEEKNDNRKAVA